MYKVFTIVLLALGLCTAQAQDAKKVTFGIRGGVNFQNLNGQDNGGSKLNNKLITRYHAGVNMEFFLAPDFYLQPGLLFSVKGARASNSTLGLYYMELPINLVFKPLLGNGHMLLGFGPYFGYGVGGRLTTNNNSYNVIYASSANILEAGRTVRPFDAGANFLVGYECRNGLSFQLNAQLGLIDISPDYNFDPNSKAILKNTGFGLSMGYRF